MAVVKNINIPIESLFLFYTSSLGRCSQCCIFNVSRFVFPSPSFCYLIEEISQTIDYELSS